MSTVRPNLKAFAYFERPTETYIASTGFAVLTAKEETDGRFILYSILSEQVASQIEQYVVGSNYPAINSSDVRRLRIARPPLPEQHKIARILSAVDDLIARTEALIAKYRAIKQGLMHDLLTRGVNASGRLRPLREEAPELYRESALGWVPREWNESTLGEQFTLQRGFDITQEQQRPGEIPVVSSSGITSFHSEAMCQGPGVVIGRKGKLGQAYYVEGPYWPHDTSLWVRDFHGNFPRFAALFLEWLRLERFDAATSVPTLNRNFIHPMRVTIPLRNEQERITDIFLTEVKNIEAEEQRLAKQKLVKAGLMQDLLTGRVRVMT